MKGRHSLNTMQIHANSWICILFLLSSYHVAATVTLFDHTTVTVELSKWSNVVRTFMECRKRKRRGDRVLCIQFEFPKCRVYTDTGDRSVDEKDYNGESAPLFRKIVRIFRKLGVFRVHPHWLGQPEEAAVYDIIFRDCKRKFLLAVNAIDRLCVTDMKGPVHVVRLENLVDFVDDDSYTLTAL